MSLSLPGPDDYLIDTLAFFVVSISLYRPGALKQAMEMGLSGFTVRRSSDAGPSLPYPASATEWYVEKKILFRGLQRQ
jgi:hypothetical protein